MILEIVTIYPILEKETEYKKITMNDLADRLNISINTLIAYLTEDCYLTVLEAQRIKKAINSHLPLERLFKREGD